MATRPTGAAELSLVDSQWGKSEVRLSKVFRGDEDDFVDLTVQVLLQGDVEAAHTQGDNSRVVPTDTMRNTIYGLAQEHLSRDLERFAEALCEHFLEKMGVTQAAVTVAENLWNRHSAHGFTWGGSERRKARIVRGANISSSAGVEGLVVLKTSDSAFTGFPQDEFTILPERTDRLLATSISADWEYESLPTNTTAAWAEVRSILIDHFFSDWSASVQHQGYLMGEAVLAAVPEISEISFRLPNQHHLPFDLTPFGMDWDDTVFHPVTEPYGDIYLTVARD